MDIVEIVVESIVDKYKESAVSFINDKDKFLNLFFGNVGKVSNEEQKRQSHKTVKK